MKKIFATLLLIFASLTYVYADVIQPVKWNWEANVNSSTGDGIITIKADIDDGFHIYGFSVHKGGPRATSITFDNKDITFDGSITPSSEPVKKFSKVFDLNLEEWSGEVIFTQKFKSTPGKHITISGSINYMACSDKSCLSPQKEHFEIEVGDVASNVGNLDTVSTTPKQSLVNTKSLSDGDGQTEDWWKPVSSTSLGNDDILSTTSWWSLLIMGFGGGLLALLTPCVWPMIPMTLSFFLKKSGKRTKSIRDALIYGLSIIVIFLLLGIAITLAFGAGELNKIATSAVFNIIFFLLLVVFAISFFGAFEIKLPSKWSNAVDNKAESTTGLLSIFFMAFTLVLVSFSCTGPIIGTLLVEAASNGSIIGPAIGMGGFALGLALPFSIFALFPTLLKTMPRSGGWMNSIKVVLGFIELILSLKFLSVADLAYGWHILDREVFISIWIVLFALLGLYLLGKLRFSHDSESKHTSVGGFFLAVISFSFAVYLIPGLWGAPLKSISAFAPPLSTQDFNLYGGGFKEFNDFDEGMSYAAQNNLPVFIDFSGYACVNCRKMEGAIFDASDVRNKIEGNFVLIKLMVDDKKDLDTPITITENGKKSTITTVGEKWAWLQRHKFNINSQPYYALLDNTGQLLTAPRDYNEDVEQFIKWLDNGLDAYKKANDKSTN